MWKPERLQAAQAPSRAAVVWCPSTAGTVTEQCLSSVAALVETHICKFVQHNDLLTHPKPSQHSNSTFHEPETTHVDFGEEPLIYGGKAFLPSKLQLWPLQGKNLNQTVFIHRILSHGWHYLLSYISDLVQTYNILSFNELKRLSRNFNMPRLDISQYQPSYFSHGIN